MKIKIEQSGGFAGIPSFYEMESSELPPSIKDVIKELLDEKESSSTKNLPPKGAADSMNYKIIIKNGKKNRTIECNELQMNENVKSLVHYLQKNSNKMTK